MSTEAVPMPDSLVSMLLGPQVSLFAKSAGGDDGTSLHARLFKAADTEASKQDVTLGVQDHPYDFAVTKSLTSTNEYHSACIHTKVEATVGLGFIDGQEEEEVASTVAAPEGFVQQPKTRKRYVESKVDKTLDPLCDISFADLLHDVCEDYHTVANGYIEVVRMRSTKVIVGLYHVAAECVKVWIEDAQFNKHYVISGQGGSGAERHFAAFGDYDAFIERYGDLTGMGTFVMPEDEDQSDTYSEIIAFRHPTSRSRWYGFAPWLSGIPSIELAQMLLQWKFDFFLNRGVPEFIFLLTGARLRKEDWTKIENSLKANIGLGNSHKSIALNIDDPNVKAQVEKLAMESKGEDTFDTTKTSLGMSIVTAHRVPPLLAGIQIPGKLGATNELPNALMAFQVLVIGQAQRIFQQTLAQTLGSADAGLQLEPRDFAFTKIIEEIDVGQMDTVARMRQTPMQASNEGRNLSDGTKN